MNTALALFIAGLLTIFLPCILPLVPIVLGVSVAGRSRLRPLLIAAGMVTGFVGITFLFTIVLAQFVEAADVVRIATYYFLLLFGLGFLLESRGLQLAGAVIGSFFFWEKGIPVTVGAAMFGMLAMILGGRIAGRIQTTGAEIQQHAAGPFVVGLTLGLVWVPCAGPALAFAFTLVREQPGLQALFSLMSYALGAAVPLILIGYGGQAAVRSVRAIAPYTGLIKKIAGVILLLTAVALQMNWLQRLQTALPGGFGEAIEEQLFRDDAEDAEEAEDTEDMKLPLITRAPEFTGLSTWFNGEPLTMADLKGSVVLIDFWTYSCINCIRTLPYIQGYWEKFGARKSAEGKPAFVLIGMHTPEFVFEKSAKNVADAIERHGLTYPVAQDNDFGTWNAFANRYWPAKYLIDAEGYIRYTHFGEGAYEETDEAIASLLKEIGIEASDEQMAISDEQNGGGQASPETYMGSRSWPALANAQGDPSNDIVSYAAPATLPLHRYALVGDRQLSDDEEYQAMRSGNGEIRMHFLGDEINLVMGMEEGNAPAMVEVWVDGARVKEFVIDKQDLFDLWKGPSGDHEIILKITGKGAQGYAFTFGG